MRVFIRMALAFALSWYGVMLAHGLAGESGDTITVIVTGVGKDADSALKNAYRGAVEQAVGTIVDTETLIKNGDMLSDKILSFSAGFVQTYQQLGESKVIDGGLVSIRISAEVKRNELDAQLRRAGVLRIAIDGKSLFAEANTREALRGDGIAWLAKMVEDLPKNVLETSLSAQPRYDVDSKKVVIGVSVKIDPRKYDAFTGDFADMLLQLGAKKSQTSFELGGKDNAGDFSSITLKQHYGRLNSNEKLFCLAGSWPKFNYAGQRNTLNFDVYSVSDDVFGVLLPNFTSRQLIVEAVDADSEVLAAGNITIPMPYNIFFNNDYLHTGGGNTHFNCIFIIPALAYFPRSPSFSGEFTPAAVEQRLQVFLDIPMEKLDRIVAVNFSFELSSFRPLMRQTRNTGGSRRRGGR